MILPGALEKTVLLQSQIGLQRNISLSALFVGTQRYPKANTL